MWRYPCEYDEYDIANEAGDLPPDLANYITKTESYEACREHMASMIKWNKDSFF